MRALSLIWLLVASSALAQAEPPSDATADDSGVSEEASEEESVGAEPEEPSDEETESSPAPDAASSDDAASPEEESNAEADDASPETEPVDDAEPSEEAETVAPAAKVVVVLVGDPDEAARADAQRLEQALRDANLELPSDSGVRGALRGESGEDDGLDRVRAERRQLGWGDDDSAGALRIGEMTQANLVVLLRRNASGRQLDVFDVRARAFFEDTPALEPLADATRFVRRAGAAAMRRSAAPSPREVAQASEEANEEEAIPPVRLWFRKNWPYLVAGALLIGAVLFLVFRDDDDRGSPVLRFRPGE